MLDTLGAHTTPSARAAYVQHVLDALFNHADLDIVDEAVTPDSATHDPDHEMHGRTELRAGVASLHAVFPDFRFTIEDQVAEGDRIVFRYRAEGTHSADFKGVPATGRRVSYTGMLMVRLDGQGARIAEFWAQPDLLGVLQQLGARVSLPVAG